jgi:hypothetical protein
VKESQEKRLKSKYDKQKFPENSILYSVNNELTLFQLSDFIFKNSLLDRCREFHFSSFLEFSDYVCSLSYKFKELTLRGLFFLECSILAAHYTFTCTYSQSFIEEFKTKNVKNMKKKCLTQHCFFIFCCGFFFRSILYLETYLEKKNLNKNLLSMQGLKKEMLINQLIIFLCSFCAPEDISDEMKMTYFIYFLKFFFEGFLEKKSTMFGESLFEDNEVSFKIFYSKYWKRLKNSIKNNFDIEDINEISLQIISAFGENMKKTFLKDDNGSKLIVKAFLGKLKITGTTFD